MKRGALVAALMCASCIDEAIDEQGSLLSIDVVFDFNDVRLYPRQDGGDCNCREEWPQIDTCAPANSAFCDCDPSPCFVGATVGDRQFVRAGAGGHWSISLLDRDELVTMHTCRGDLAVARVHREEQAVEFGAVFEAGSEVIFEVSNGATHMLRTAGNNGELEACLIALDGGLRVPTFDPSQCWFDEAVDGELRELVPIATATQPGSVVRTWHEGYSFRVTGVQMPTIVETGTTRVARARLNQPPSCSDPAVIGITDGTQSLGVRDATAIEFDLAAGDPNDAWTIVADGLTIASNGVVTYVEDRVTYVTTAGNGLDVTGQSMYGRMPRVPSEYLETDPAELRTLQRVDAAAVTIQRSFGLNIASPSVVRLAD